nr:MAG TPA: NTP-PPase-like protein [Caudoviricetes sp.]
MRECYHCIFELCKGTAPQCARCSGRRMACTGSIYQKEAMRTANGMHGDLLQNGVMGLCGEAGECVDLVKKHLFQGHELDKEHLAKELGDVAWYLAVTAEVIGYDLNTILQMNVKKLRDRYPNGFEEEHSKHRKKGDI